MFIFLAFVQFGPQFGDRYVAIGDDVAECFPVSRNFPLFATKNHSQICVSLIFLLIMKENIVSHNLLNF